MSNELYHYGVQGMKWGVRRYQYADGTYTPLGKKRYSSSYTQRDKKFDEQLFKFEYFVSNMSKYSLSDTTIKKGEDFYRVQSSKEFEKLPFYATYKKQDVEKYLGLFGKNLQRRAHDDQLSIYHLRISSTNNIKTPSDKNASYILSSRLKHDKEFKDDVKYSLEHSKEIMRRPIQQTLFKEALRCLNKPNPSEKDLKTIYKAFNLSLTNHEPREVRAQQKFYKDLQIKGYSGLLDYNDKSYSSYHAKHPVIIFDLNNVSLSGVSIADPKLMNRYATKYNRERFVKEIPTNSIRYVGDKIYKKI